MKLIRTLYSPGEAAAASGRSVENQRNDRRAGYDAESSGHARYDLFNLARLSVRQLFADRGVGPQQSQAFLNEVAGKVCGHLIHQPQVWDGAALDRALSGLDLSGIEPDLRKLAGAIAPAEYVALARKEAGIDSETMGIGGGIVVWPNGEFTIDRAIWNAYGNLLPSDPRGRGVVQMMVFYPVSVMLAQRLPRPIYDVVEG